MTRALRLATALALAIGGHTAAAQAPQLEDVITRVHDYVVAYERQLSAVVAEEAYIQTLVPGRIYGPFDRSYGTENRTERRRTLRSDYALTPIDGSGLWLGYRDTFEVDGRAVRDRDERLRQSLASGASAQAARITAQSAQFNLAEELLTRDINVPTFALQLLHPRRRDRFSVRRAGSEAIDGRVGWVLEFREREKPTIVRQPGGGDQAARVLAVIDPLSGTVMRTTLSFEHVNGSIVVTYGRAPMIPVLVPLTMSERYTTQNGSKIGGEAVYTNFRQFQTSGRLMTR